MVLTDTSIRRARSNHGSAGTAAHRQHHRTGNPASAPRRRVPQKAGICKAAARRHWLRFSLRRRHRACSSRSHGRLAWRARTAGSASSRGNYRASGFGELLRAIDGYEGMPWVRAGLQLLALTFVRPGELRAATWHEFDTDKAVWTIPAERAKMRRPHRVPLSHQAINVLDRLRTITGQGHLVLPGARGRNRPLSENTLNAALCRLEYTKNEMTSHGFRASASSILNESGKWNPDAIEAQLAHVEANAVRRAYARAEFWKERIEMMDWWGEKLDQLRRGADIIPMAAA